MPTCVRWLIVTGALCVVGCPVPPSLELAPKRHWQEVEPTTGGAFFIYEPSTYSDSRPAPVIISCHGTPPFDVAEYHVRTWKALGEQNGCIIIAPVLKGTDGILGDGPLLGMLYDERLILSIISLLTYRYNIDRNNIMITGFSGGGFPTYWVGLRHPDVFSVVVARNCNFSKSNVDGWYPPEATEMNILIYYGENDPGAIQHQSKKALEYFSSRGFKKVQEAVIPGAGHERHPQVAMDFFRRHWRPPLPSIPPRLVPGAARARR